MPTREVQDFISHWSAASASERANSQPFLLDLCDLLDVPRPDPQPANGYFFEFPVVEHNPDGSASQGRIDLYRRAHFVLESKQFQEARAEASQAGKAYLPFPDPRTFRIRLADLTDERIRERLVALNAERAAEEKRGIIHWLRPDYQARSQKELVLPQTEGKPAKPTKAKTAKPARPTKTAWPKTLAERVQAVETALHAAGHPVAPEELARQFVRAKPADVAEILQTLVTLGRARRHGEQFTT